MLSSMRAAASVNTVLVKSQLFGDDSFALLASACASLRPLRMRDVPYLAMILLELGVSSTWSPMLRFKGASPVRRTCFKGLQSNMVTVCYYWVHVSTHVRENEL